MNTQPIHRPNLRGCLAAASILTGAFLASDAKAQFPNQGDDLTFSLGRFTIVVNPVYQPFLASINYPGYDDVTKRLTSPILFDSATRVGRSSPFLEGSPADINGVLVGSANTLVKDSNLTISPFEAPAGTREVHTELRTLNLTGPGGAAVRAGTAAPDRPGSYGEVESRSHGGVPSQDFRAESYFNIFVDVDLPGIGTVHNPDGTPLVVANSRVESFPPRVVYSHQNSTAVEILFNSNVPLLGALAGDTFGILTIAGHGVNMSQVDEVEFEVEYELEVESQVESKHGGWAPGLRVIPEPNTATLALFGLMSLGIVRKPGKR